MPDPIHENPQASTPTTDGKAWWQSITIRAALLAMIPSVAHLLGLDFAAVAPYSEDIVTLAAAALAIFGRVTATAPIGRG